MNVVSIKELHQTDGSVPYTTYAEYLRTKHWKEFTKRMRLKHSACELCNQKAEIDTHHLTYKNLGNETEDDVMALCRECHFKVHRGKIAISEITTPIQSPEMFSHPDVRLIKNGKYLVTNPVRESGAIATANKLKNVQINGSATYVRLFDNAIQPLAKLRLTGCEQAVMLWLGTHARTGSGAILHGNNKRITRDATIKSLGFGRTAVNAAFNRLLKEGIISVQPSENPTLPPKYFFNPYVLMRGRYVDKELYQRFKDTKWAKLGLK